MRHLRPQFAILAGTFALAVLVSLFASVPSFCQKLSLDAHALVPAKMAAGRDMTVINLGQPSLTAEFYCVARLTARLPAEPLALTGLGLAIARDLAVAQGGALKLTHSTKGGSELRLQLPMEMFTSGR